ncbi:RbsD/FucU family protein [Defluviitalea phaphyphila]|uniref:RbsD/FucU family protein n=1 Tax=Defluviitalea phaphyphila TaxID=1473580 RepID=UPI000730A7F2|nr:RbsD/FucU domain-containing protein [Defluviitalea phaphyphila]
MLKCIPASLSPELVKILMEMGHGDEIVLGDRNFPSASHAKRLIRYDGMRIKPLLEDILKLFPLDYIKEPVTLMKIPPNSDYKGDISNEYKTIAQNATEDFTIDINYLDRQEFYDRASKAYAIVATGETERFANIIIRKGVIK